MAKLEYPIELSWKGGWGAWEALRELIQNVLDAGDAGDEIKVWRTASGVVHLRNDGTPMTRADLVLGASSKGDGRRRGRKGEGMKIAMLTLVRLGLKIQVRTGLEKWVPSMESSEKFGGKEILVINTSPASLVEGVDVQIEGLHENDWNKVLSRVIDSRIPGSRKVASEWSDHCGSKILIDETCKGLLFVGGLFVADLTTAFGKTPVYGYDFHPSAIELDSDRKLADPWMIRYRIGAIVQEMLTSDKIDASAAYDMLRLETLESDQIGENYVPPTLKEKIKEEHARRFDGVTIGAKNADDQARAADVGIKAPIVGKAIASLLDSLDKAIETAGKGPKRYLDTSEYDATKMNAAIEALNAAGLRVGSISVVEFWNPNTMGECQGNEIRISKEIVNSPAAIVATLIHEIAHRDTGAADGDPRHQRAIEDLSAQVICHFTNLR